MDFRYPKIKSFFLYMAVMHGSFLWDSYLLVALLEEWVESTAHDCYEPPVNHPLRKLLKCRLQTLGPENLTENNLFFVCKKWQDYLFHYFLKDNQKHIFNSVSKKYWNRIGLNKIEREKLDFLCVVIAQPKFRKLSQI